MGAERRAAGERVAVAMRGVTKRFPGVVADDAVDFTLLQGEVHALVGENGAGKTTLMNLLAGVHQPDDGTIEVGGRAVYIRSPRDAERAGIGMVHQELMLAEALTVAENVALGWREAGWLTRWKAIGRAIEQRSRELGLEVDPRAFVWQLSIGERQRVEILRALLRGARILLLDEPTAVLGPRETDELFRSVGRLVAEGRSVVLISHKLDEVTHVADRFTVMRGGKAVASGLPMKGTTREQLAELMVGRSVSPPARGTARDLRAGKVVLALRSVTALGDKGTRALNGVTLEVHEGELVGVAGVAGNGQRELAEVLSGMRPIEAGRILIESRELQNKDPAAFLAAGLAYVPEDRRREGAVTELSVKENLALKAYRRAPIARTWGMDRSAMAEHANRLASEFGIRLASIEQPAGHLSGGNLQRLILARELSGPIRVLLAAQPTRGLDVGATHAVHALLLGQREAGIATLIISEDLSELMTLSDRLVVLFRGRIAGTFAREEFDREAIGRCMAGLQAGACEPGRGDSA